MIRFLTISFLVACGFERPADVAPPDPLDGARLVLTAGADQSGVVASTLETPFLVTAIDGADEPVADLTVDFVITSGDGSLSAISVRTDIRGQAQTTLTLGTVPGTNTVEARTPGVDTVPVVFSALANVDVPAAIAVVSGDEQSAIAGSQLEAPLVVRVADRFGNPTPSIAVSFAVIDGEGTLSSAEAITSASGEAAATLTLDRVAGDNRVEARVAELAPVEFAARGLVGPPHQLVLVGGGVQSAAAGATLPEVLVVRVADSNGNGVSNQPVQFAVVQGGGSVTTSSATTDAAGEAQTTWTLGPGVGENRVEARAPGLAGSPLTFTANGTTGSASRITMVSGNSQAGTVNTQLPNAFVARVTDANNNPVEGFLVSFVRVTNNGTVTTASAPTNAQGIAQTTFKLGTQSGGNRVEGRGSGLQGSPLQFDATGTPGPATQVVAVSGAIPLLTAGTGQATLMAQARDQFGNGVSNVQLAWSVTSGSGTFVSPFNPVTDAGGVSRVTIRPTAMQSVVAAATATGLSTAQFGIPVRGFRPPTSFNIAQTTTASDVEAVDLNADGKPDLVVSRNSTTFNNVGFDVFFNGTSTGSSVPSFSAAFPFAQQREVHDIDAADLNSDGKPDLVYVAGNGCSCVGVMLSSTLANAPAPSFGTALELAAGIGSGSTGGSGALAIADINQDSKPDLITTNTNDTMLVFLNTTATGAGTASFAAPLVVDADLSGVSVNLRTLEVVDLNVDNKPDLVSDTTSGLVFLFNNTAIGSSTAAFSTPRATSCQDNFTLFARAVAIGDLGGDTKPDLVCGKSGAFAVLTNNMLVGATTPSFTVTTVSTPQEGGVFRLADFTGGRPDLLIPSSAGGIGIAVHVDAAQPTASFQTTTGTNVGVRTLSAGDFNADGRLDVVAVASNNTFSVLLGE